MIIFIEPDLNWRSEIAAAGLLAILQKGLFRKRRRRSLLFIFQKMIYWAPKSNPFNETPLGDVTLCQMTTQLPTFFLKNGVIQASISVYFRLFNMSQLKFKIKLIKHRWCTWDSNPGRQDGRCRLIHWATAAPLSITNLSRKVLHWIWKSIHSCWGASR